MYDMTASEGLYMEILESIKDIVKGWIDAAPLSIYGYFMQYRLCDEVRDLI